MPSLSWFQMAKKNSKFQWLFIASNAIFGSFECVLAIVVPVIDTVSEKTYLQCKYFFFYLHLPYELGKSFFLQFMFT
jgi:hypothetical protein